MRNEHHQTPYFDEDLKSKEGIIYKGVKVMSRNYFQQMVPNRRISHENASSSNAVPSA